MKKFVNKIYAFNLYKVDIDLIFSFNYINVDYRDGKILVCI